MSTVLGATLPAGFTPPVLTNYLETTVGGTLSRGGAAGRRIASAFKSTMWKRATSSPARASSCAAHPLSARPSCRRCWAASDLALDGDVLIQLIL